MIKCRNLVKTYGSNKILNNLSFTIEGNKITGIIGRNGVGKTTLLNIIAGHIKETSGDINVFSEKPFNSLTVSANTIFVDENMTFPKTIPLGEVFDWGKRFYPNWNHSLSNRLLDYFSFNSKQYHHQLSKGKTSTFNLIFGLASRCPLTILDEPMTGMDESVRKDMYQVMVKDFIAFPRTILISSHHLDEIDNLIEDVLLLKKGQVLLHQPISELTEWAGGIKGPSEKVKEFLSGKEILFEKELGKNTLYAVVKNNQTLQLNLDSSLEISSVKTSDLCVYLTNETKGGIDDVFSNN
ncbi:ABC transporter ATP-binding protein [Bacillus carboniphilus]|uniref:ABC transporter ATP-binding protein n=1 Tax=Bacillus carboniphilus TaxID=86663 RepID=A0ABY9JUI3_9BACI|nr:ABC transporter ATP-binding protein [Bacillus carboniphilus]WLR43071.1 ABC transporter ATP-binding protein [Bacillus carboniphilus]